MLTFFLFSLGIILGIIPCLIYGRYGGDEKFCKKRPKIKKILKIFHHYMLGIAIIFMGFCIPLEDIYKILIIGWGTGTTIDDLLFHSFELYFERTH